MLGNPGIVGVNYTPAVATVLERYKAFFILPIFHLRNLSKRMNVMTQDNNIVRQIEQFHSEWSKMDLGSKMGFLMGKQIEINSWANALARNRAFRGYFTQDEMAAVQQLQDVQNELDRHKAEVNRDLYNEISKELIKVFFNI